jgi:hypothetical protein
LHYLVILCDAHFCGTACSIDQSRNLPMSNGRGQNDVRPRQCPAGETWVNGPMKFCPECGANPLCAASRAAAASQTAAHHLRPQFYAVGGVAVLAIAFTAYGILHRNETARVAGVQGSVLAPQEASAIAVTGAPVMREAPALAQGSANAGGSAARAAPTMPARPAMQAPPEPPVTAYARGHRLPGPYGMTHLNTPSQTRVQDEYEHASGRKGTASTHADVARNPASARASLDKNDLMPARRALMSVLAEQPGNFEAQQMQTELASREGERDSLLGYARLCGRDGQWVCAWHNAGHALTVDASSQEAREMLSRAIAEHGASASRSFDPSLPGGDGR